MDQKQEILMLLRKVICEQLLVEQEQIAEQSTWAQLGADSLDRIAMTLAIEDAFHVEIPHQIGERLNTVGETVDHLSAVWHTGFAMATNQVTEDAGALA